MAQGLSLANEISPLAQTFKILNPKGAVLTSVGLYFRSKPGVNDLNLPVTIELRPVTEGGFPSSLYSYPNTRVSKTRGGVSKNANFQNTTETRFTFESPLYVPGNTEVALVVYTNNTPGKYKVWVAKMGEFVAGRTDKRITTQPAAGSFFKSSNGTSWSAEQSTDLAFNIYQADFGASILTTPPVVALVPDNPPLTAHITNPIRTNNGSNLVYIDHFDHGFQQGEDVRIYGLDSAETTVGIPHTQIMGTKTIQDVDPDGYTIQTTASATDSDRFGGTSVLTTEQYAFDQLLPFIPTQEPVGTDVTMTVDLISHKSWGGTMSAGVTETNIPMTIEGPTFLQKPAVIRSEDQENGTPSATFKATMTTTDRFIAPHINWMNSSIRFSHNLVGTNAPANYITTHNPYVASTEPVDTSVLSQHIASIILLDEELAANSIKVLTDVDRPNEAQFDVWYRTGLQSQGEDTLLDKSWNIFSKNPALPDYSSYLLTPPSRGNSDFREYEFFKQDIPDFDMLQIKITMTTTNSSRLCIFRNLRTIAAI